MNDIKRISLKDIVRDLDTQMRVDIDPEVVEQYAHDMDGGDKFPPVDLMQIRGSRPAQYLIVDGWKRVQAAESLGQTKIDALVSSGEKRDAVLLACGVNANHGQHRTPEDIRKILTTLFEDEEWGGWSSRTIATHAKVAHKTVDKYRALFENEQLATVANSEPATRVGVDGKVRQVKAKPDSFDVEELEEQVASAPSPAKRNGKPLASSKDRDEARKSLSSLIKSLNRLGIYDEFIEPLSAVAERLKQI